MCASPEGRGDDLRLVRAALEGEPSAREELASRLRCVQRALAGLDLRSGGLLGREERRDLTQEVLTALWARLAHYTGEGTIEAWAQGFCVNTYRNAVRKLRRRAWLDRRSPAPAMRSAPDPSLVLEHEDLCAGLAHLERQAARAILLKCLEGLTFTEIGARLGLSPNTVKTVYYRGLRRLALDLGPRAP